MFKLVSEGISSGNSSYQILGFSKFTILSSEIAKLRTELNPSLPNPLSTSILKYLDDQSEYPIYELTDTCLNADYNKAIQRLRQAQNHSVEPTLLLWCLTQEIRQLINLHYQIQQGKSLQQACQILKIWSSKVGYYEKSIQRLSYESLLNLLQQAQAIDRLLKTGGIQKIWIELERLIMQM